jgi:hypothetical protein
MLQTSQCATLLQKSQCVPSPPHIYTGGSVHKIQGTDRPSTQSHFYNSPERPQPYNAV